MFKELFLSFVEEYSFFNIFRYQSFRGAYAAVTALLISLIAGPAVIKMLARLKFGQEIRHDGPQSHLAKAGTPTMGGILMILSVLISVLLWQDLAYLNTWIVIVAVIGFGLLGFTDDFLKITRKNSEGLRAGVKFMGQILVAGAVVTCIYIYGGEEVSLLYLPFLKNPVVDLKWLYIPFGMLLIVGFSNAVNLTDGLDGLATGLMIMEVIAFAALAYLTGHKNFAEYLQIPYISGSGELFVFCFAILGALIGFLWFNCHPAEVMMGDTGSLMLGGVLGAVSLIVKKEILLLVIGGVFVIETASVIIQVGSYKLRKKRVFKMAPIHHHFELKGWKESKVITRFWILGGMFAIIGLSTLKIM